MKNNPKRPITVTLLLIWIGYMIFRGVLKLINLGRLEQNKQIFGKFAIVDYWIDAIILIAFILIFISLIKKRQNTWRYIIGMAIFLMIGTVIGQILAFILVDKIVALVGQDLPRSVFLFSSVISTVFLILFYSFIIWRTYKSRNYFTKPNNKKQ